MVFFFFNHQSFKYKNPFSWTFIRSFLSTFHWLLCASFLQWKQPSSIQLHDVKYLPIKIKFSRGARPLRRALVFMRDQWNSHMMIKNPFSSNVPVDWTRKHWALVKENKADDDFPILVADCVKHIEEHGVLL